MFERTIAFLVVVAGILALGAALNAEDAPPTVDAQAGGAPPASEAGAAGREDAEPGRKADGKGGLR